jgi:beta-lactam-binding protein with PASTA domain
MDAGRNPDGAHDDAAAPDDETTLPEEDWPVADLYRIEPPAEAADEDDAVAVEQAPPPPAASPVRRFPPEVGRGVVAGLLAVLLLAILVPAGLWLVSREDGDAEAVTGGKTPTTATQPTTEPPAPTEPPATTEPRAATVPDVTGRTLQQAREALESANLRSRFRRVDSERPRDEVLSQAPEAGGEAQAGSIVVLTVSGGQATVAVPDVEGMSESAAVEALRDAGLESRTRRAASDERRGTVVSQTPAAGEEVDRETVVALRVSDGPATPATVTVPDLVGMGSASARSRLRSLGLRASQRPVESPRPAGEVVSQTPAAGAELREGGTVTLQVSTGPSGVAIPDVVGLMETAAVQELEAAGFTVRVVDEPSTDPTQDGLVLRQSPQAGETKGEGSAVTITVARLASG